MFEKVIWWSGHEEGAEEERTTPLRKVLERDLGPGRRKIIGWEVYQCEGLRRISARLHV